MADVVGDGPNGRVIVAPPRRRPATAKAKAPSAKHPSQPAADARSGARSIRKQQPRGHDRPDVQRHHVTSSTPAKAKTKPKKRTRILTLNIRQAVGAKGDLENGKERKEVLKDVAAYIRKVNPDVVLMQEVRNPRSRKHGVARHADRLGDAMGATDQVWAASNGKKKNGNAVFTRNGYRIDHADSVRLAGDGQRAAIVASVRRPDGDRLTVVDAHLSNGSEKADQAKRDDQLRHLKEIARKLEDGKAVRYRSSATGTRGTVKTSGGSTPIVLAGDLNSERRGAANPDKVLGKAGLRSAEKLDDGKDVRYPRRIIDHAYVNGARVVGTSLKDVPARAMRGKGAPTDHPGYIVDIE